MPSAPPSSRQRGRPDRVGLGRAARLADRGHVIDVDAEFGHAFRGMRRDAEAGSVCQAVGRCARVVAAFDLESRGAAEVHGVADVLGADC